MGIWMGVAGRGWFSNIAAMNGSGRFDGVDDLLIARAAAEVPLNGASNFLPSGVVVLIEKSLRGYQKPGRAKATLRAAVCRKARLDGCEVSTIRKALDRDDVRTLNLTGEGEARQFGNAVDHDGATSAGSEVAASFHAQGSDFVPKHIEQDSVAGRQNLMRLAVHGSRPPFSLRCGNHRNVLVTHHARPPRFAVGHGLFDNWGSVASYSLSKPRPPMSGCSNHHDAQWWPSITGR